MGSTQHGSGHSSSTKLYWVFCAILSFITFIEWAALHFKESYNLNGGMVAAVLVVLSLIKFVMVVGWYMHLRYDIAMLKQVFIASTILITGIAIALVVIMTGEKHAMPKKATSYHLVPDDSAIQFG